MKKTLLTCIAVLACIMTNAQIKIGDNPGTMDSSAVLEMESTTKGMLLPRMTAAQRDAIPNPSQGLMIYNIDADCFETYNANSNSWKSNCGVQVASSSTFSPNCAATSVQGTYQTGVALVPTDNTITLEVNVTQLGTYAISTSANGMTFGDDGTFTTLGTQNITLEGNGYSTQSGANFVSITAGTDVCNTVINATNGIANVTACGTLGTIAGNVGTFTTGVSLDDGDVDASLTGVTYTGTGLVYGIATTPSNGIRINATLTGTLDPTSPASIDLSFAGTPVLPGNTIINYSINNQAGCTLTVPVLSGTGRASAINCGGALAGTYTSGTAMAGTNTKIVTPTVTTAGVFNLRTDVQNGVYFAGTLTTAVTGAQAVTLTAVGTPVAPGTFTYTITTSATATTFVSCTFTVSYVIPVTYPNFTTTNCGVLGTNYTYIKASNTTAGDAFGGEGYALRDAYAMTNTKMSADGLTMVTGAVYEDGSGVGINPADNNALGSAGAAYVFTRATLTSAWTQQAYIKPSVNGGSDYFGMETDISDDGNTIIVGAFAEDGSGTGVNPVNNNSTGDAGAAYVFSRTGSTWTQQAYLKASNTGGSDWFGHAVSVSGDGNTVAVGAYREDGSGTGINPADNNGATDAGAAYVFVRSGGVWTPQATIKASNTGASDWFGFSLALSTDGNTMAVGAYREDGSGTGSNPASNNSATDAGAVYVYSRTGATWTQQSYLKASNAGAGDFFGFSVDLSGSGNTLVVGAHNEGGSGSNVNPPSSNAAANSGAAYIFNRTGSAWTQAAYVKASNTGANDYFGWACSISQDGKSVMVGAPGEDGSVSCINAADNNSSANSGAVYHYYFDSGVWNFASKFKSGNVDANDWFGSNCSQNSNGKSVAIGAGGEDGSGVGINPAINNSANYAGAVYIFNAP